MGRKVDYSGFLSDFLGEASEVQGLGKIPVVCVFLDVFTEVSLGLPLVREVELCILCVWGWSRYPLVPIGWHLLSRVS